MSRLKVTNDGIKSSMELLVPMGYSAAVYFAVSHSLPYLLQRIRRV